jgi:hypothetical protein
VNTSLTVGSPVEVALGVGVAVGSPVAGGADAVDPDDEQPATAATARLTTTYLARIARSSPTSSGTTRTAID